MGGSSAEREVSLSSGRECSSALREAGYRTVEVDADGDLPDKLSKISPDAVFNALHGTWGEDGCVQGILEWMKIPYTHSGVMSSALAMDKHMSKIVYTSSGLPVAESVIVSRDRIESEHVMAPPYVIKPNREGSSIGVYIVDEDAARPPKLSPEMPQTVMVEKYVKGRELTVSVMGGKALGVTDILTEGWYDYDSKYRPGGSRHQVPANIPETIESACLDYALRAHGVLGCRGLSRTDFRWDEEKGLEGLVLLETNTQPGMTPTSLSPEQARVAGVSFLDLCKWLVEDASCDR